MKYSIKTNTKLDVVGELADMGRGGRPRDLAGIARVTVARFTGAVETGEEAEAGDDDVEGGKLQEPTASQ